MTANILGVRRPIFVHLNGLRIKIRSRSPDLQVVYSSLIEREYDNIRLEDTYCIVDAGANIGTSAIAFSQLYPKATIIAVEPEAENYSLLVENTSQFPNVKPVRAALAGKGGVAELLDRGTGDWGFTITETAEPHSRAGQQVRCVTIPDLMGEFGFESIDILKLDIEGGEREVLQASSGWINGVRVVIAELHDRICAGCTAAFESATRDFPIKSESGEKRIAKRG